MPKRIELFLLSALILFLELLLIRWISTEVSIFAYLQNAVLICCFLGLGMGCMLKSSRAPLRFTFINLSVLSILLSIPTLRAFVVKISLILSLFHDFTVWNQGHVEDIYDKWSLIVVGGLCVLFLAWIIWNMMLPLGSRLATLMNESSTPIFDYSINIFGSLIGIWLFSFLSLQSFAPPIWFIVLAALCLPIILQDKSFRLIDYLFFAIAVVMPWIGMSFEVSQDVNWSPYQKLEVYPVKDFDTERLVLVNNIGYQEIQDNSPEFIRKNHPDLTGTKGPLSQYDIPGRLVPQSKEILIVGSGTGNDVAGALRTTGANITAVEIDPVIVEYGRKYHPEKPYESERVELVLDDARAAFMRLHNKFDLIVFGLLDSHSTPALTNARLDHYVYTIESLTQAKSLLSDSGVLVLIFQSQRDYVTRRHAQALRKVFSKEPLAINIVGNALGWGGTAYIIGSDATLSSSLAADDELANYLVSHKIAAESLYKPDVVLTTDNWPYLYLEKPTVPMLFIFLGAILIALWIWSKKSVLKDQDNIKIFSPKTRIFIFMGIGFSLFEVYGVNQAAILFGSTWFVNSIVISAILFMILFSNLCQQKLTSFSIPRVSIIKVTLVALIISLTLIYMLNFSNLISLSFYQKLILALAVFGAPMFLSGIIFATLFEDTENRGFALGANLFGALLGGVLQFATFPFGIKSLLLLAVLAYLMALVYSRPTVNKVIATS
jgi:hypothetical protein